MSPTLATDNNCYRAGTEARRSRTLTWIFAVIALAFALFAARAQAATTYDYVGNFFTSFCGPSSSCVGTPQPGVDYRPTDRVTAKIELTDPLPPNLNLYDISALPGFILIMTDGHQTLRFARGDLGPFEALLSTDATGSVIGPWSLIINCCQFPNNGIASLNWPGNRGIADSGSLSGPSFEFPNTPSNSGHTFSSPGIWTVSGGNGNAALSYGAASRVHYQGPFNDAKNAIRGGAGTAKISGFASSTLSGTQSSRAQINSNGPNVGAWSSSSNGSGAARAIAFRTYVNASSVPQTIRVNAVFDGRFENAPFQLPNGTLRAGAAIHVFDAQAFAARLATAGSATAQFLLGSYALSVGLDPGTAFANLRGLFPQGLIGTGQSLVTPTASPVTVAVSSGFITVAPGQTFTVMYDVSTSSAAQTIGDRTGGGSVNFLNTMAPAAVPFTGLAGEPVNAITPSGTTPTVSAAPSSIVLTPTYSTHPAGSTASIVATVAGGAEAIPETPVQFVVSSGPNAGKSGVAVTDNTGKATFEYVGDHDTGKDVIQASIATLRSNTVEHVWSAARCPQNQVFWIRYPGLWPASSLEIGGVAYDQQTLLKLLKLVPLNPSLALLQQEAVAKLNTAYGGDTSKLTLAMLTGDDLLRGFDRNRPQQNQVGLKTSVEMLTVAAKLALYNAGLGSKTCR